MAKGRTIPMTICCRRSEVAMKPRHHIYLDDELTEKLDALAAEPGSSKSAIVSDALRAYLARRGARELDDLLKVRIGKLGDQLGRVERNLDVVLETLALYVRYQLAVTPPLPEADQKAARAVGHDRFQTFIAQVGRRIAGGRRVADELQAQLAQAKDAVPEVRP
jgi:Arc/MetJ family transcription regulator